ncbi:response regulator receiver sensor signal transduction histidine kinase [Syntrophobotulus glycolicus DSM 8271]|uniref:Stage 0 sporulation protein A homolog n=1 Tax=Syntrophobotulus glycolicus (strain DSM 8271 / FlGlyR) TaxID=645991 RepID=F0STZ7_SYNGF|nr:response regulator [Syntrophobotulus glycolicus]ADY56520.1 response regulator receiver sensor signal transduction histidine kinase [Syntrophobotulus glycolicus DSM 8271]
MEYSDPSTQPEILLVDDTPEHIETAVSVLCDHNFKVRIATKGITALKLIDQHLPDLILLDVYMPEMDGFEVCKTIKRNPDYIHIPIIFLTSSNDEESIKKGFAYGAQDYVIKPFNSSELLARVNTHIKLKQQTKSLLQANRELDSFCYSVSHDLKAPLLSISRLIDYLVLDYSPRLDNDGHELLDNIQKKSNELIMIIDHLLEFSRMSEMELRIEKVDLEHCFRTICSELIKLEPQRKIQCIIKSLPIICADPIMMKLLVSNILSNALKYTRNKAAASIEITSAETPEEYIVSIKDNGEGFDMRYSDKLFKVFQRLHAQNEFEGSGVGLAICQKILQRHHGRAWLTGKIDQGACFSFSFPKQ